MNFGFSVERNVIAEQYYLDILASCSQKMVEMWPGRNLPWSGVVAVSGNEIRSPNDVGEYSSFLWNYFVRNRDSPFAGWNNISIIPVVVSSSFDEETKRWVAETPPALGVMWGEKIKFSVLVDLDNREIICPKRGATGTRSSIFGILRFLSGEWFSFDTESDD